MKHLTADPPVASAGSQWVLGLCWLYCRRSSIPVRWIGPYQGPSGAAPMFGCGDCIAELDHMAEQYQAQLDRS